ncbi:hypothetical protein Pcinc_022186 [Petrolisthes cinctipes]|uniref:Uncharacterized protein n=1 Tax=Petrolisthes cinctipes TaxID=88211 RepID=A0AAE1KE21_PETCI|nr:hypothetical protein Pcinc_022186 [Petrolisthes cinctipes]
MLGESVVVVGGGGGGGTTSSSGTPLHRPRSADNLSRLAPASSLPALDDLAESEVFVGDEEEEFALHGDVRHGEELYMRPSSLDYCTVNGGNSNIGSPDLLSPTGPTPTTNLIITYHDDSLRLPLDAVKEEVEAEALEEASMIMSSGPGSLSHVSLTSSIISTNSLDDSTVSSRTDTFDTVLAAPVGNLSPPPETSHNCQASDVTNNRPANRDTTRVAATPARTSPTSPRGSSGHSSPNTPERRRKTVSVTSASPRSDSSRGSTPRSGTVMTRSVGRSTEKNKPDDKKAKSEEKKRRIVGSSLERKPCIRASDLAVKRDTDKPSSYSRTKTSGKDQSEDNKCGTLGRKKKIDTKDFAKPEADLKSTSSFRLKKEGKTDKDETVEKYGTLGRRKKARELGDSRDDSRSISKDTKNTLDMYATLPRKKAREMSARWREQMAAEDEASKTSSLRRTKSVGKTEAGRSRGSIMTTSLPSSALTCIGRPRSPRSSSTREGKSLKSEAKSTSTTNLNPRKERTIICMETGVQTSLTGGDVTSALRALSRQGSACGDEAEEEAESAKLHVAIIREMTAPEDLPDSRSVEVQVELAWRLGEGELPEHVRRLTEEHTRLQTEHARARARLEEMEGVKEKLEKMKASLEDERAEKEEVQGELDLTSQRVKDMLVSMEGVEHEFNSRGDSLMELESQLHQSADIHIQMQDKLNKYEEYTIKVKRDLDKSLAAQKILLQQVQDLENEGREIADFMSEEKNALSECLREAELELVRLRKECEQLSARLKEKDEEARHMVRLAEERKQKCMKVESEMKSIQSRTRDMMVCQGAEVSGAAVSLANLSSRLHTLITKLVQDYSITDSDLEMIVTPQESDSSASSTNGTPERKAPYKVAARAPSPRKTASFIAALLNAMRMGPKIKGSSHLGALSPCNGVTQTPEGRNSPEGSESHEVVEDGGGKTISLADQVTEVDLLLTRFLKVCCVLKNDTDNRLTDIEDENERLCSQIRSQQQVIDQQHSDYETASRSESKAKRELMATSRDLELANQNLAKIYEADYELQVMKLQEEVERLGASSRHLEALHAEKEKQLEEALSSLASTQTPSPPAHIPEAVHFKEVCTLNDKVASLRQSVIERDRRIGELSDQHSQDMKNVRETQLVAQCSTQRFTTTVDHVLKTLESVPDIVSSSPVLKQLFSTLAATENSTQQLQQQNGNITTQNGFGNSVNNKDLNANPQSIIDNAFNKKMISSVTAETHL